MRFGVSSHFCGAVTVTVNIGTPLKINVEHNHGGLEDHFPF